MVQEAVGVIRNIDRSRMANMWQSPLRATLLTGSRGRMLGNHITVIAQRVQNMGFGRWAVDGAGRGGQVQFSNLKTRGGEEAQSRAFHQLGLTRLAYRTPDEIWVSGGSSNLLCSFDGGKTWEKDREVEDVPSIL